MKNEKGGGKQGKRSAQKHRKSSPSSRKGKTSRSLTLAEKSGLDGRDVVVMADVGRMAATPPAVRPIGPTVQAVVSRSDGIAARPYPAISSSYDATIF